MPPKRTPDAIDPRLLEQIDAAHDTGTVQAVVMVALPTTAKKNPDPRGPAGSLVDRVSKQTNEKPVEARYLARLGGVVITASGRFMTRLLKSKSVVTATSADADIYGPVT
ncbi:MAG: hypothetical protein IT331_25730 [Anaerolineae bacterium]|nr:hypothetical protein [Anaerolineae bacterium]